MKRRHDIISYVLINQLTPHPAPGTAFVKVRPLRRELDNHNLSIFCFPAAAVREDSGSFLNFELGMLSFELCAVGALGITQMPELFRGNVKK